MGWDPSQVGRSSLWDFMAALDGFERANGKKKKSDDGSLMTPERMAELGIEGFTDE